MSSSYSQPQHCFILDVPNYCLPTINALSSSAEQMNHNMSHWSLCKTKSAVNRHTHLPARSTNASLPRKIWERYWFRCFLFTIISNTAWELKWVQTNQPFLFVSTWWECSKRAHGTTLETLLVLDHSKIKEVARQVIELQHSSSYDFGCICPALIPTELCSRNSVACSPKNLLYIHNQKKSQEFFS